ncbi:hypothetical protein [Nitrospina gracilis]|uniref:hypothetical protein n=1 Tax=Nitrospina gracilis TaxID=35801 RepID=UPI001F3B5970|nr:hypothetical protein [Nitrospina gracilis]MCF8720577.1 cell fate (sporulation/competence/biofilm development) regulator YmcA (YheA/YmcA/DUF963 family) [Nitrospina gracilis Nb-211]
MLHFISKPAILAVCLAMFLPGWGHAAEDKVAACLSHVTPLQKKKEFVIDLGGMWSLFERSPALRKSSSQAVQLESKVNELIFVSNYLCQTLDGVPPNDLAIYVTKNIEQKGKKEFRKELRVLGISHEEIDKWFEFADFSLEHLDRKLKEKSVETSIHRAEGCLLRYKELAIEIEQAPREDHLKQAAELKKDIDKLEADDANLSLGLWEIHQVPHWDYYGSVGGS